MFLLTITNLLTAIGWALLNSIWQMGLLFVLAAMLNKLVFKSATARHAASVAALVTGVCWFLLNLFTKPQFTVNLTTNNYSLFSGWNSILSIIDNSIPYLTIAYLCWVAIYLFRLAHIYTTTLKQQKTDWQKLPAQWRLYIQQQSKLLGVKTKIRAFISTYIDTPQVIGILKPIILIPASCVTYLNPQQLEAVLLHEIAHIKRNDFALNVFITVIEMLFFFNPFARKLADIIRKEREYSCDDWVLQFQYQPAIYAAALMQLEKNRSNQIVLGIAANNGNSQQLLLRVKRIAGMAISDNSSKISITSLLAIFIFAFLFMLSPILQKTIPAAIAIKSNPIFERLVANKETSPAINNKKYAYPLTGLPAKKAIYVTDIFESLLPVSNKKAQSIAYLTTDIEEEINYSLDQPETIIPNDVLEKLSGAPFVPSSSFNYQFIEDTLEPNKEKRLLLAETEALHNARIALENMHWEAIAKELKFTEAKVKQLKNLVLKELAQADIENTKQALVQQQANAIKMANTYQQQQMLTNEFRQQQAILEILQQKMRQEQQQLELLKNKQESDLKQLESEQKRLQQTARKKRIIYI